MLGVSDWDLTDVVQKTRAGDITESWKFILQGRNTVMQETVKNTLPTWCCLWEYFRDQICRGWQVGVWRARVTCEHGSSLRDVPNITRKTAAGFFSCKTADQQFWGGTVTGLWNLFGERQQK